MRVCLKRRGECECWEADLCDVSTTALPSWMTLMMAFQRKRREWGSIPVVGSSCANTNAKLHSPRAAPHEHRPNPLSPSAYGERSHIYASLNVTTRSASQCVRGARPGATEPIWPPIWILRLSPRNPCIKTTSRSQTAITLCRSWNRQF